MNPIINLIEPLAANAWPPEIEQPLDGWKLRYTQSVTRRANSVLPLEHSGQIPLDQKISLAEEFYAFWQASPCFQMTVAAQPKGLVQALAQRGYQDSFHTQVQTAPLEKVLANTSPKPNFAITLQDSLFVEWLGFYTGTSGYDQYSTDVRRGILSRIEPQARFALLSVKDQPAAVGLGVLENGWVGVYCMVTHPDHRRKGAATHILHVLADWGQNHSADNIYLQVMENNPKGLALYKKAGFKKAYQYWYAMKLEDQNIPRL
jgi:GNAT superfamily N-acetyltransferase